MISLDDLKNMDIFLQKLNDLERRITQLENQPPTPTPNTPKA